MVRKAFTLIELLVVIAVLGCLVAIAIPGIRHSKLKARAVVCASNLGQLSILLNTYAAFQGAYPPGFCNLPGLSSPPGGYIGNFSFDRKGWYWFHFIVDAREGLSSIEKMISCPSSPATVDPKFSKLCRNYGINYSISKIAALTTTNEFYGSPLRPVSMRRPAQNILLADSGYSLISWKAATMDPTYTFEWVERQDVFYVPGLSINSQKTIHDELKTDAVHGRHPNRTLNIICADGASKRIPAEDLLIAADKPPESSEAYLIWSPSSK
jgi:prepilin-type N-terminal cleavage/methylation domain-containing protein